MTKLLTYKYVPYVGLKYYIILPSYLLTCSIEQGPSWEANRFSASQDIPRILWNQKVHYRIHKCPPPALSWTRSTQSTSPRPTSWRSILILSFHISLGLPNGLFPSGFPTKTQYTCKMHRSSHSSRFDHPNNTRTYYCRLKKIWISRCRTGVGLFSRLLWFPFSIIPPILRTQSFIYLRRYTNLSNKHFRNIVYYEENRCTVKCSNVQEQVLVTHMTPCRMWCDNILLNSNANINFVAEHQ